MVKNINDVVLRSWREAIRNLPPAIDGHGGQNAIWFACHRVREMGVPLELAIELMSEIYNPLCDKPWSDQELNRTVRRTYQEAKLDGESKPRWPVVDGELRDKVLEQVHLKLDAFSQWAPSPSPTRDPYFFIDRLFPDAGALVCLGAKPYQFRTERKEWWKDKLEGIQLIVPNQMSSRYGLAREGHRSQRSDKNTGPRQYQIIEFDLKEYGEDRLPTEDHSFIRRMARKGMSIDDINASLIAHLGTKVPLVLAVHSGGKVSMAGSELRMCRKVR